MEAIKNIHSGKVGFVLGAGWSLNNYDIQNIVNNGISFACNASVLKLTKCDYFCLTDGVVPTDSYYDHAVSIAKNIAYMNPIDLHGEYEKHKDKAILLDRRYLDANDLSFDITHSPKLIVGLDVVHVATHLAYIMGCSPIVLLGVDLCWKDKDTKYFHHNRDVSNSKFFYLREMNEESKMSDKHLLASYEYWVKIKQANPDVNILSGSDGILDMFTKTNLNIYG